MGDNLEKLLAETDILYVTRVQKERFASELRVKDAYRLKLARDDCHAPSASPYWYIVVFISSFLGF